MFFTKFTGKFGKDSATNTQNLTMNSNSQNQLQIV